MATAATELPVPLLSAMFLLEEVGEWAASPTGHDETGKKHPEDICWNLDGE